MDQVKVQMHAAEFQITYKHQNNFYSSTSAYAIIISGIFFTLDKLEQPKPSSSTEQPS